MKSLTAAVAATLFAAGVGAADLYHGLDEGNSDLSSLRSTSGSVVATQPGVGDSVDRYQGWADGNPDLFEVDPSGPTDSGSDPDIYMNLSGSPDLHF